MFLRTTLAVLIAISAPSAWAQEVSHQECIRFLNDAYELDDDLQGELLNHALNGSDEMFDLVGDAAEKLSQEIKGAHGDYVDSVSQTCDDLQQRSND
ncbi:hypothetical protein [Tranquillimonas rosea]|uniref:hypothetical protein n=1 Tax=Tranquillimonas rosea TaxID=641238 RepID=UPI003BA8F2FA